MRHHDRPDQSASIFLRPVTLSTLLAAGVLVSPLSPITFAQNGDIPAPPTLTPAPAALPNRPATIDLSIDQLISLSTLLVERIEDPVWDLQVEPGKQYLAIPVVVPVSDQTLDLDANVIRIRGGRFVAWRIPTNPAEGGIDPTVGLMPSDAAMPGLEPAQPTQPGFNGLRAIAPDESAAAIALPPGVSVTTLQPMLARSITVEPAGKIRWNLERFIPTGTVREADNLYNLKIRSELLTRKEPLRPRPEPPQPGDTPQARADRARASAQANELYRQQAAALSELRRAVMAAPSKFEAPRPQLLWAIFDVSPAVVRDLQIDGPPPLPWRISLLQLESLRSLAKASVGAEGPSRDALMQLHTLVQLVAGDPHPLNLRLASQSLAGAKLFPLSQPGDDVHNVSRAILDGKDPAARSTLIRELVAVTPPTDATLGLLKLAARNADPTTQLMALTGLAQSQNPEPEVLTLLLETANRLINAADAPPALTVLDQIFTASRGPSTNNTQPTPPGTVLDPAALTAINTPAPGPDVAPGLTTTPGSIAPNIAALLAQQVRFQFTDTLRRDDVILALIQRSNTQPLAAYWLSTQLLGSTDSALTQRTLQLLASAKLAPTSAAALQQVSLRLPRYALTVDELFGQSPSVLTPNDSNLPAPAATVTLVNGQPQINLTQPLVIAGGDHAFLKLLRSDTPAPLRELAWQALPVINFPTVEAAANVAPSPDGSPVAAPAISPFAVFADIAAAEKPLSVKAVDFLARQPNLIAASNALIRLGGHDTGKVSDDLLRGLLGSNRPLDQSLAGMTIEDALRFARRLYDLHAPPLPASPAPTTPATTTSPAAKPPTTSPTTTTPPAPAASPAPTSPTALVAPARPTTPPTAPTPPTATVAVRPAAPQPTPPASPAPGSAAPGATTPPKPGTPGTPTTPASGSATTTPAQPATRAPQVVGLLRDRQKVSTVAAWFMREVSAGRLPDAPAWAQAYGGESALLQQVYSSDDELAVAAAAGLLATVNGPSELAKTWSNEVRGQPNRSPEFAAGMWQKLKQEVFILRLKSAAGPYRLSLRIYPTEAATIGAGIMQPPAPTGDFAFDPNTGEFGPPTAPTGTQGPTLPQPPGKPTLDEALGILVLQADGKKVTFASQPINVTVPDTAFLLRLDKPIELKNLPNPKVAEIPWDRQIEPIDLWPQPDGSWLARFRLVDGRISELQLKPVPAGQLPPIPKAPTTPATPSTPPAATKPPIAPTAPTTPPAPTAPAR